MLTSFPNISVILLFKSGGLYGKDVCIVSTWLKIVKVFSSKKKRKPKFHKTIAVATKFLIQSSREYLNHWHLTSLLKGSGVSGLVFTGFRVLGELSELPGVLGASYRALLFASSLLSAFIFFESSGEDLIFFAMWWFFIASSVFVRFFSN